MSLVRSLLELLYLASFLLLGFGDQGMAQVGCVPNPNLSGPPFTDGCRMPASGLNNLAPGYDIRSAGAVCDDVTDDTATIQTALNSHARIFWPKLACKTTATLTIPQGVLIEGEAQPTGFPALGYAGYQRPLLDYQGTAAAIKVTGPIQGWGIKNLTIWCSGNNTSSYGIEVISAEYGDVSNIGITNCYRSIFSTTLDSLPPGYTNVDSLHNAYRNITITVPAVAGAEGITLTGTTGLIANTDYNEINNVTIFISASGTYGLYLQNTDSDRISNVHMIGGAGPNAVVFDYTLAGVWPASVTLDHFDVGSLATNTYSGFLNAGAPSGAFASNYLKNLVLTNTASSSLLPFGVANLIVDGLPTQTIPVTLTGSGGGAATTSTSSGFVHSAEYMVGIDINVVLTNVSTLTGNLSIAGLPLPLYTATGGGTACAVAVSSGVTLTAGFTQVQALIGSGASSVGLFEYSPSTGSEGNLTAAMLANNAEFVLSCSYARR